MRLTLNDDSGVEIVGLSLPEDVALELGVALVTQAHDGLRRRMRTTADFRNHVRSRPVAVPAVVPNDPRSETAATLQVVEQAFAQHPIHPAHPAPVGEPRSRVETRGTFAFTPMADAVPAPIVKCPGPESCDISAQGSVGNWEAHHHLADGQTVMGPPAQPEEHAAAESVTAG